MNVALAPDHDQVFSTAQNVVRIIVETVKEGFSTIKVGTGFFVRPDILITAVFRHA